MSLFDVRLHGGYIACVDARRTQSGKVNKRTEKETKVGQVASLKTGIRRKRVESLLRVASLMANKNVIVALKPLKSGRSQN